MMSTLHRVSPWLREVCPRQHEPQRHHCACIFLEAIAEAACNSCVDDLRSNFCTNFMYAASTRALPINNIHVRLVLTNIAQHSTAKPDQVEIHSSHNLGTIYSYYDSVVSDLCPQSSS